MNDRRDVQWTIASAGGNQDSHLPATDGSHAVTGRRAWIRPSLERHGQWRALTLQQSVPIASLTGRGTNAL